jgi:hypothetical protein
MKEGGFKSDKRPMKGAFHVVGNYMGRKVADAAGSRQLRGNSIIYTNRLIIHGPLKLAPPMIPRYAHAQSCSKSGDFLQYNSRLALTLFRRKEKNSSIF